MGAGTQLRLNDDPRVAENDLRKIHAEVIQVVSQRFQLTTLAVLIFAAVCGWATSSAKGQSVTPEFGALVSTLLLVVLGALYIYFTLLLGMLRIFTVYMATKYDSPWELEWKEYRNMSGKSYLGYSRAAKFIFQFLGLLSVAYPACLLWVGGQPGSKLSYVLFIPIAVWIIYYTMIKFLTNWRDKIADEALIRDRWTAAIQKVRGNTNVLAQTTRGSAP